MEDDAYQKYLIQKDHEAKVRTLGPLEQTLKTCSNVVALVLRDNDETCDIYYRGGCIVPVNITADNALAMCYDIIKRVK